MIIKNDGWTLTTVLETTVQRKGDSRQPEFPNSVSSLKEKGPDSDHASTRAAETVLAKESSAEEGKRSSTWDIDILLKRWTRTNEHLGWELELIEMFFGKEGMITLNVVITMRRNCEEVESVLDYGFTDFNM